jgi:CubicO group peptidase (beta-lactamase class C family)
VWPAVDANLADVSLEDLLRHRSGLAAWRPIGRSMRAAEGTAAFLLGPEVAGAAVPTYSDLGYVLWTRSVERLTGEPAATLLRRHVLRPLGLTTVGVYREIIPNEKLVFTWGWEGPERHETLVTIELSDRDGGTELVLLHERFADQAAADHHGQGWRGCLENLATRITGFS